MNKKTTILFLVVLAVVLIAGSYYYFFIYKRTGPEIPSGGTVESLMEKVAPKNPLEKLPETNPVDQVNPFKGLKINPFK